MVSHDPNCRQRMVFGTGIVGGHHLVPEVLECGWGRFDRADRGHLQQHVHANAYEFCYILSGEVEWQTRHASYVLSAGDMFLTRPGEPHWGRDLAMHPCTLYWLIVAQPDIQDAWAGLDPKLANDLRKSLDVRRSNRLPGTPSLQRHFAAIFAEHERGQGDGQEQGLRTALVRAILQQLLIETARMADNEPGQAQGERERPIELEKALFFLGNHGEGAASLRQVCQAVGSSEKRLNDCFQEHFGLSMQQYWLRERIRRARLDLADPGKSITAIAASLGFSSSQHFATAFRKVTGLQPSEFRATLGSDSNQPTSKPGAIES